MEKLIGDKKGVVLGNFPVGFGVIEISDALVY